MGGSTTWSPSISVKDRRHLVVVPAGGRLGNQIFQYAALRAALPDDFLLLVDFEEFNQSFEAQGARHLSSKRFRDRIILRGLNEIGRAPWIGRGDIRQASDTHLPAWTQDGRVVISRGFYQAGAEQTIKASDRLRFRTEVLERARSVVASKPAKTAFIHLRRGDYLVWPSVEEPAALPDQWYADAVNRLRDDIPSLAFVVVSDDPTYAAEVFVPSVGLPDSTIISRESSPVDLAIMSLCEAGILSASTFSWWGAALARNNGAGPFFAPERWLGFRGTQPYPHAIEARFLESLPVKL